MSFYETCYLAFRYKVDVNFQKDYTFNPLKLIQVLHILADKKKCGVLGLGLINNILKMRKKHIFILLN